MDALTIVALKLAGHAGERPTIGRLIGTVTAVILGGGKKKS